MTVDRLVHIQEITRIYITVVGVRRMVVALF